MFYENSIEYIKYNLYKYYFKLILKLQSCVYIE